jgi:hypothetical protein
MRYPGLSFSFDEDGPSNGTKKSSGEDRLQAVKRLTLTQHSSTSHTQTSAVDLDLINVCPALDGELERAVFTVKEGAILHFYALPPAQPRSISLRLGQTRSQDVLIDMGPPLRVHDKDDDRMAIHSSRTESSTELQGCEYFSKALQSH